MREEQRYKATTSGSAMEHDQDVNGAATPDNAEQRADMMPLPHKFPIFINEDLTRTRATLLWKARAYKKANKINDGWSTDGTILVKKFANKIIPVRNMDQLEQIAHV